ncbi:L-histidine N(alpha)-methyltransferase (plasmid) [Tistrella mobilis]|uniref:L-histidine N(alpha)-methyltransferase n=1 Tax=Tistrella mobilis TaxID=171437 RepID=UPI0035571B75
MSASPTGGITAAGPRARAAAAATDPSDLETRALRGLTRTPKCLPPALFYDDRGSALFDRITRLDAYYPTRAETAILRRQAREIAAHAGSGAVLVDYGAGSSVKTRLVLDALDRPAAWVPIDVSAGHLERAAAAIARDHPGLVVAPLVADFTAALDLPDAVRALPGLRLGFFPGSTIGNLAPDEAVAFLRRAASLLGREGRLIVGVDLVKDEDRLLAAYDDPEGVTAAFNLNLLARLNREARADFDPTAFAHRVRWNAGLCRIEMHLESLTDQVVSIAGRPIRFRAGETIHTENSHKFTPESFARLASRAGWRSRACWTDAARDFSVHELVQSH